MKQINSDQDRQLQSFDLIQELKKSAGNLQLLEDDSIKQLIQEYKVNSDQLGQKMKELDNVKVEEQQSDNEIEFLSELLKNKVINVDGSFKLDYQDKFDDYQDIPIDLENIGVNVLQGIKMNQVLKFKGMYLKISKEEISVKDKSMNVIRKIERNTISSINKLESLGLFQVLVSKESTEEIQVNQQETIQLEYRNNNQTDIEISVLDNLVIQTKNIKELVQKISEYQKPADQEKKIRELEQKDEELKETIQIRKQIEEQQILELLDNEKNDVKQKAIEQQQQQIQNKMDNLKNQTQSIIENIDQQYQGMIKNYKDQIEKSDNEK